MALSVGPALVVVLVVLGAVVSAVGWWAGLPEQQLYIFLVAAAIPPAGIVLVGSAPPGTPLASGDLMAPMLAGTAVGTLIYGGLAVVLWRAAVRRFEREWEVRQ